MSEGDRALSSMSQAQRDVFAYGKQELNTLDVYTHSTQPTEPSFDVYFIHGGAWRDPKIDLASFEAVRSCFLQTHESSSKHVHKMCSINYRLSPHPGHPTSAGDPDHNACFPDHVNDIFDALGWLQARRQPGRGYILVGHSAGATLAFQVCMAANPDVVRPVAVVGLCGIYDLPRLVDNHAEQVVYRDIVEGAFGKDQSAWSRASPVQGLFHELWPEGRAIVLAQSRDDELVEQAQIDLMREHLLSQGWQSSESGRRQLRVLEMSGCHDDIWKKGIEGARAIDTCLQALVDM